MIHLETQHTVALQHFDAVNCDSQIVSQNRLKNLQSLYCVHLRNYVLKITCLHHNNPFLIYSVLAAYVCNLGLSIDLWTILAC